MRFNQIKRSKRQRRIRGGFTLLETLIASSILMVVLGTVYATAISMTRRSHSANDRHALGQIDALISVKNGNVSAAGLLGPYVGEVDECWATQRCGSPAPTENVAKSFRFKMMLYRNMRISSFVR